MTDTKHDSGHVSGAEMVAVLMDGLSSIPGFRDHGDGTWSIKYRGKNPKRFHTSIAQKRRWHLRVRSWRYSGRTTAL